MTSGTQRIKTNVATFVCSAERMRMPGWRCQVKDCDQISIHNSPRSGSVQLKWKNFVCLHRKNFNPGPVGKFPVCSDHFTNDCFTRAYPMKGLAKRLKPGTIPTIWKKTSAPISQRSRRRVREVLLSIIALSVAFPRQIFDTLSHIYHLQTTCTFQNSFLQLTAAFICCNSRQFIDKLDPP